jgi:NAD(P)-dependent dehydrogenase (short-subunit alcohol dehydrogenase family)
VNGPGSRFAGRVALITGASRGIGLAIAERIVAEGGRVCITGRNPDPLNQAMEHLGGPSVAMAVAGASDDSDHQWAAVQAVRDRFGGLDVLVNNTGINPLYGPLLESDAGAMRKILEVNLLGSLAWVKQGLTAGLGDGGAVVNVASVAGLRPARGIGFYGASKAALMHLTQQLALELAPTVRVNAVAPAVVRTPFSGPLFEGKETEVAGLYPLGRLGAPEDVAAAVAYLASDDAAWITGQVLTIDGGLTLTGGI